MHPLESEYFPSQPAQRDKVVSCLNRKHSTPSATFDGTPAARQITKHMLDEKTPIVRPVSGLGMTRDLSFGPQNRCSRLCKRPLLGSSGDMPLLAPQMMFVKKSITR